jgi:hypothetical protein
MILRTAASLPEFDVTTFLQFVYLMIVNFDDKSRTWD